MPNPFVDAKVASNQENTAAPVSPIFANRASGNTTWKYRASEFVTSFKEIAIEFIVRAIQLALAKFVLELCAMIIDAIMKALQKSGVSKMDISSPNVAHGTNAQSGYVPPSSGGLFNRLNGRTPIEQSPTATRTFEPPSMGW